MISNTFQIYSHRQIVGQVLDHCYGVLKAFLDQAIQHDEISGENLSLINKDLSGAISFFITNYDYIQESLQNNSKFLRNLLFELKHYRNNWAHSRDFSVREVHRSVKETIIQNCRYSITNI